SRAVARRSCLQFLGPAEACGAWPVTQTDTGAVVRLRIKLGVLALLALGPAKTFAVGRCMVAVLTYVRGYGPSPSQLREERPATVRATVCVVLAMRQPARSRQTVRRQAPQGVVRLDDGHSEQVRIGRVLLVVQRPHFSGDRRVAVVIAHRSRPLLHSSVHCAQWRGDRPYRYAPPLHTVKAYAIA